MTEWDSQLESLLVSISAAKATYLPLFIGSDDADEEIIRIEESNSNRQSDVNLDHAELRVGM